METRRKQRTTATEVEMDAKLKSQHAMELKDLDKGQCYTNAALPPIKFTLGTNDDKFVNRSELEHFRIQNAVPDAICGFLRMLAATDDRRIESIEFVVNFVTPDSETKDRA